MVYPTEYTVLLTLSYQGFSILMALILSENLLYLLVVKLYDKIIASASLLNWSVLFSFTFTSPAFSIVRYDACDITSSDFSNIPLNWMLYSVFLF